MKTPRGTDSLLRTATALIATLLLALLIPLPATAVPPEETAASETADWAQFRGPGRDGVAHGETLRRAWGDDGPAEVWRRPIGDGFAGIAAAGGRLYTMAAEGEIENVLCLDAATGVTVWRTPLGRRFESEFGDGPRATPTVDGDRVPAGGGGGTVYAVSADVRLAALAAADGAVRWRRDLPAELAAEVPRFGFSSSPLVDGDLLVLDVGGTEGRGVVAFDKRTGAVRWTALDDAGGHSSPIVAEVGHRRQYVFNRRTGPEMVAVSTAGEVLWRYPSAPDAIVMPLFVPPDRFFISSAAMGNGGVMVRVSAADSGLAAREVWTHPRMRNHFNTSVLVGGHIYGFDNATLRAIDAETGEAAWARRGFGKGSVIASGDLLLVLGDQGTLALVEATPERYRELGRVQALAAKSRTWTPPTLAGGRVYLRDHDEIVSYDVAGDAPVRAATAAQPAAPATAAGTPAASPETAAEVVARYAAARGGLERWRAVGAMELAGTYAAFSERSPFTLLRRRDDRYRIELEMLGHRTVKARDAEGPWWVFPLLGAVEPTRVESGTPVAAYLPQLAREALFEPPLIGYAAKNVAVELLGRGEVDGRPTVDLAVKLPGGQSETWMLDPATWLEVAVDATVYDFTQGPEPMTERTFFSDFREVGGLVLPHRIAIEFGARLEEMTVEEVVLGAEIDDERFRFPGPPGNPPEE